MITFLELELLHWDIQPNQKLYLTKGVNLVTGENGSGKTSILDALKVCLGASHLGGGRNRNDYLNKQSAPIAMIRLVVDNSPAPSTRRRPFDVLGEFAEDRVTLAVVFQSDEVQGYILHYYMADGDVIPLIERADGTTGPAKGGHWRTLTATEYRQRLHKVGITRSYMKLLCLPQGDIANFCSYSNDSLFDYLFDLIGGRTVLEEWQERLRELNKTKMEHEATATDLEKAQRELTFLRKRVERYEDYKAARLNIALSEEARPYLDLQKAQEQQQSLRATWDHVTTQKKVALERIKGAETEIATVTSELAALDKDKESIEAKAIQYDKERTELVDRRAEVRSRHKHLLELKTVAEGIEPEDREALAAEIMNKQADLSEGEALDRQRRRQITAIKDELQQIEKGVLPLPKEVSDFVTVLRREGIPHHVLANVVEITDTAWTEPIEAFLDRYRFSILVQDLNGWRRAAELARTHRYAYGVLAPDVRGSSPSDEKSINQYLTVNDPRYRALVARLVRTTRRGSPAQPYTPLRHHQELADDGFFLSRIEARVVSTEQHFLGRNARLKRKKQLEAQLKAFNMEAAKWVEQRNLLAKDCAALELRKLRQEKRADWLSVADEYSQKTVLLVQLDEKVAKLDELKAANTAERSTYEKRSGLLKTKLGSLEEKRRTHERELKTHNATLADLSQELEAAEHRLGELETTPLAAPSENLADFLRSHDSLDRLDGALTAYRKELERFSDDDADDLLPTNFERQKTKVASTESHLRSLATSLEELEETTHKAHDQYIHVTKLQFRRYYKNLSRAAELLDFTIDGHLESRDDGKFSCTVSVGVADKPPVSYMSEALSGGQKAAISILMGMTAVSDQPESAGFFLIDEPFSASDVYKVNELGSFLSETGAQYLVSMPTSANLRRCGSWLKGVWACTKSRGGYGANNALRLAPPVKHCLASGSTSDVS